MQPTQVTPKTIKPFHTFGEAGVVYEVLEEIDDSTVKIRVVETGETLNYSRDQVAIDPLA